MSRRPGTTPAPGLQISDQFTLPLESVTETFAILARRGSGKTSTAVVMTEELVRAHQQVVVLDPLGVWFGLRASVDGVAGGGLPVVIIGGEHGDLPLPESRGRDVAQLLVTERPSAVLDLSLLSKPAMRRFAADFLEELSRSSRHPCQVVVDEADLLAPQRASRDSARVLGAMEDVIRRGRVHGLGAVLISQRPASLSKDVLSQTEVLIAMRMTNPRDVAAIDEWVKLHADPEQAARVKASLPSLPVGTAWIWSPGWLDCLEKVEVRPRTTFDSSSTPKPGTATRLPSLSSIDVAALRAALGPGPDEADSSDDPPPSDRRPVSPGPRGRPAATRQPAATGPDPRDQALQEARARAAQLRAEISRLNAELDEARQPHLVEVPVLDDASKESLHTAVGQLKTAHQEIAELLRAAQQLLDTPTPAVAPSWGPTEARRAPGEPAAPTPRAAPVGRRTKSRDDASEDLHPMPLKAGAQRMLAAAIDHHPTRLTRAQLATLAKMKVTGGTFSTYLSTLRRAGLLNEDGHLLEVTAAGLAEAGAATWDPRSAEEVRAMWRSALKAGARRMLDVLVDAYPVPVTREDLAAAVDITVTGGTFSTYLSTLRRNGLVSETPHGVLAHDVLFMDPARSEPTRAST